MFSTGTPRSTSRRASVHMASSEEYDGRSQSTRATPSFRSTRLVVYGNGARAYAHASRSGTSRCSIDEHGTSRTRLVPGRTAESYDRKYGRSGASTKSGPPLCAS